MLEAPEARQILAPGESPGSGVLHANQPRKGRQSVSNNEPG